MCARARISKAIHDDHFRISDWCQFFVQAQLKYTQSDADFLSSKTRPERLAQGTFSTKIYEGGFIQYLLKFTSNFLGMFDL